MAENGSNSARTAAGITLLLSVGLAAVILWALIMPVAMVPADVVPPGPASAGHGVPAILGGVLSIAVLLCALWTVLVLRGIGRRSETTGLRPAIEAEPVPAPVIQPAPPPRPAPAAAEPGSEALMLLSLLQEKGRFVDFVMDDIAAYSNEQVGAAARVVHQGCREVVTEAFAPQPVAPDENARMTLEPGYDAGEFRLVGRAPTASTTPVSVKVTHKGWRARHVKLPRSLKPGKGAERPIIVPAEVAA